MTDIFDEVEEDLRRERLARAWDRYGIYVILVAILIVVVTAGWRGYEWWRVNSERTAGEAYVSVLADLEDAGAAASTDDLEAFASDAPSGIAMLARFRAATAADTAGDPDAAAQALRDIIDDSGVPALYRDLARVRLAQVLLDSGDPAGAGDAVKSLAEDAGNAFNRSALELMGLAAYARDDLEAAQTWFSTLSTNATASQQMRQRAEVMLRLVERVTAQEAAAEAAATRESEAADATPADATPATGAEPAADSGSPSAAPAFPLPGAPATEPSDAGSGAATPADAPSFPMPGAPATDTGATTPEPAAPASTVTTTGTQTGTGTGTPADATPPSASDDAASTEDAAAPPSGDSADAPETEDPS